MRDSRRAGGVLWCQDMLIVLIVYYRFLSCSHIMKDLYAFGVYVITKFSQRVRSHNKREDFLHDISA